MDKSKQLFFDSFSPTKPEEELSLQGIVKKMPRNLRVAAVRKLLQIRPRKLISMEKIVDNAKQMLEMYNLQTEDLIASEEEKRTITSLVEDTIGGLEFFSLKARYKDWGNTKFRGDIELMMLDEKELAMVNKNAIVKKKMIAELIRLIEEGMDIKTVTPKKITKIYTQLW